VTEQDPQREQINRMLTDLANDPAAPPSTVDALSVIRAARAAAAGAAPQDQPTGTDEPAESSNAVPETDEQMPTDVLRFRPRRRRTTVVALLAAAGLAAVAALVIPLSLPGGSSTGTSADAERAVAASAAGDLAAAPVPPTVPAAAPAPGATPPAVPEVPPAATAGSAGAGAAAGSAAAENAPVDGFTVGAPCWPTLSAPVAAALVAALPAGAFGDPQPLTGDCSGVPVGGVLLRGSSPAVATATVAAESAATPATALVVRISRADPGACIAADPTTGPGCAPGQDGTYLRTDGPGGPTAFAYANGYEVAVGGSTDTGAVTGLSADQLAVAARAVLGALG
jgi:hypothetical protein